MINALRATTGILTLLVLLQAILAGAFLDGTSGALDVHEMNANLVVLVALAQLVLAVVWRARRGPGWPVLVSAVVLVAAVAQVALGYADLVAVHVPLGVAIFGGLAQMGVRLRHAPAPPAEAR